MKRVNSLWATGLIVAALACSCKARNPWIVNLRRAQVLVNTKPADAILELERAANAGANPIDVKKGLGIAHERLRHLDEARRLLHDVAIARPDDPEVRFELANIDIAQGRLDAARANVEATLRLDPPHVSSVLLYAALARTAPQGKAGLEPLNRLDRSQAAAFVDSAEYSFAKASLQAVTGDVVAAEAALAEGAHRNSLNPTLALALAAVSRSGNTPRFAEWLLARASNTLSATDAVHVALAELAIAQKHLPLAAAATAKLRIYDKKQSDVTGLLLHAEVCNLKNDQPERARVLKQALDMIPRGNRNQQREVAMKYAIALQQAGNVQQSEAVVTELLARDPGFPPGQLLLADLRLAQAQPDQTIQIAEAVAKSEPLRTQAYRLIVTAYLLEKSPRQAEAAARRFVGESNSPDSVALLANVLIQEKRFVEALHEVELGLARHASDPDLTIAQIGLTERVKGFAKAESIAAAAAASNPSPRVQLELAHLYQRNKQIDRAITVLQKLSTSDSQTLLELSALQVQAQRPADALASIQKLVGADPYDLEAQLRLGMLEERLGNTEHATQAYERVLAVTPDNVAALNNLAAVLSTFPAQTKRAVELARRAASLAPNDLRVTDTLGWALLQNSQPGDRREAAKLLERSAKGLDTPESLYHHAAALVANEKPLEAKVVLKQALARKDLDRWQSELHALLENVEARLARDSTAR